MGVAVGPDVAVGTTAAALCSLPDGPQPAAAMENSTMPTVAISLLINCFLSLKFEIEFNDVQVGEFPRQPPVGDDRR
jgi:hypothetical protein